MKSSNTPERDVIKLGPAVEAGFNIKRLKREETGRRRGRGMSEKQTGTLWSLVSGEMKLVEEWGEKGYWNPPPPHRRYLTNLLQYTKTPPIPRISSHPHPIKNILELGRTLAKRNPGDAEL